MARKPMSPVILTSDEMHEDCLGIRAIRLSHDHPAFAAGPAQPVADAASGLWVRDGGLRTQPRLGDSF